MNCPICEAELDFLCPRPTEEDSSIEKYLCDTCNIELHKYPDTNKKGVQMTGWHVYIPLKNFPHKVWDEFLNTERNYYGEEMPGRAPIFADASETKRMKEYYRQEGQKVKAWQEKVG